jgi:hypothetical protein
MAVIIDGDLGIDKIKDGVVTSDDLASTLDLSSKTVTLPTSIPLGVRNLIINGDMRIDQRNAGASVTPSASTSTFITDRFFYFSNTSNTNLTLQQQSSTPPSDFSFYTRVTANSAGTVASTNEFSYIHRIEGQNTAHLKWGTADAKTVTLSFWVRSSLTGTFGGIVGNNALNRIYPISYTISSANTWEKKTITIEGDTTGTWLTTNGTGIQIYWSMGCGSSFLGTAGSWGSTFYLGATGQTNLVQTNGATLDITGIQLEVGDTATPFEHRPYDMELARCQRYFCSSFNTGVTPANGVGNSITSIFSAYDNTTGWSPWMEFPVTMRTPPTMTAYRDNLTGTDGQWITYDSGYTSLTSTTLVTNGTTSGFYCNGSRSSAFAAHDSYLLRGNFTADAEL